MASQEGTVTTTTTTTPAPTMQSSMAPQLLETHTPPQSKYSKRVVLNTILSSNDGGLSFLGERVVIGGWVKSSREKVKETVMPTTPTTTPRDVTCVEILQSRIPLFRSIFKALGGSQNPIKEKLEFLKPLPSIVYLQVNDGSCAPNLQVVLDSSIAPVSQFVHTGTSILVEGILRKASVPGKQDIELEVQKINHVGKVEHSIYPLSKTRIPLESLRRYSHLRPRTTTVASITRVRSSLTQATHAFSQNNGFFCVQMPVITGIDSKSISEKFHITTRVGKEDGKREWNEMFDAKRTNLEVVKGSIKEKSNKIEELKRSDSNKEALVLALQDLQKTNELVSQLEAREKANPEIQLTADKDFFPRQMCLTVSGQLHLESYACALGNVYSFGPTFQAEKIQSMKHLAESWMFELELAFAELEDVMNCAEDYLKFLCQWILQNCSDDMMFITKRVDQAIVDRLQSVSSSSFERKSYEEAIAALSAVQDKTFSVKVEWGAALTDEHESYLAEELYKKPVIIYNYPKELKPFYARANDDGKTVATFDVIVPKVGTLIRGSQKEERLDKLTTRFRESKLAREQFQWYFDIRRHGTVKHSGFGLEFDLMVLFATGLNDIRDVTAFPRTYGTADH